MVLKFNLLTAIDSAGRDLQLDKQYILSKKYPKKQQCVFIVKLSNFQYSTGMAV